MSQVDAATGSLLETLARATSARRVLEIGTGSGDATLWIAKVLPEDGMLITLERHEVRALNARTRLHDAGIGARVSVMIGDAARCLHKIAGPFDLVLQHLDGPQRDILRPRLLQLLRTGGLLATRTATRDGEITLMIKR